MNNIYFYNFGGELGIRTPDTSQYNGFQGSHTPRFLGLLNHFDTLFDTIFDTLFQRSCEIFFDTKLALFASFFS